MAKTWVATVQNNYSSIEELKHYDEIFNICFRAGYAGVNRVKQMWDDNKIIGGSVNPEDFVLASMEEIAVLLVPSYKEAIDFTEDGIDGFESGSEYSQDAEEKILSDLLKFLNDIGMDELKKIVNVSGTVFVEMFAHDFWLTRNGHGSGFWDSECWGEFGEFLTKKSKDQKEAYAYAGDDCLIYFG